MEKENLDKYAYWMLDYVATGYGEGEYYNCSACNFSINIPKGYKVDDYNFCPNCGRIIIHKTYKGDK